MTTKYYKLQIRVSHFEFKKFKELKDNHGLSARDVIEAITYNCDPEIITAYNKQGDAVQIKKTSFFNPK